MMKKKNGFKEVAIKGRDNILHITRREKQDMTAHLNVWIGVLVDGRDPVQGLEGRSKALCLRVSIGVACFTKMVVVHENEKEEEVKT